MQRLATVVLAVSCAACGDDGVETPTDATVDTTPSVRCDPTKPFGAPTYLAELATPKAENGARLYDDERTIIFGRRSVATNLMDLYIATRASNDVPFDPPAPLATVNSVSNDAWPTQTVDGLALMFEADRGQPQGQTRPWISRRAAVTDPWGPPAIVPELAVGDGRLLLANASALYFVSSTRGGLGNDIVRSEIGASSTIGSPVLLGGTVNSMEAEEAPTITPDELTIYFRRETTTVDNTDPMNPVTTVEHDIWGATRGSASEDFGPPALVENLSVARAIETPSWISPDGCMLYASIDGPDDAGDGDIVVAARPL